MVRRAPERHAAWSPRWSPLLPLGAGTVQVLDANAVLAPLGLGVALLAPGARCWPGCSAGRAGHQLTFLPLAVAPAVALYLSRSPRSRGTGPLAWVRSREGALYVGGCALGVVAQLCLWLLISGPVALDGVLGELESPLPSPGRRPGPDAAGDPGGPPAPAGPPGVGGGPGHLPGHQRWRARRRSAVAWCCAPGAAVLPLFAVHQGTIVGVARPAEPFVAVRRPGAPAAGHPGGRVAVPAVLGAALVLPLWHDLRSLATRPVIDPSRS